MTTVDLAAATQTTDKHACLGHPEGTSRRTALLGIAVAAGAVCAGCSSSKSSSASTSPSTSAAAGSTSAADSSSSSSAAGSSTGTASSSASSSGSSGAAGALAATSAVPVGGGTVLTDQKIVLTQPTAGTFKAFTAVCTHQGCVVGSVANGLIVCPCHGSAYHIADGSVANGPAPTALAEIAIKVSGGEITQA
ncbi:Rieske (2Fe-2S) domain protein [Catenulispora acidiphila DSM 44928]|uniref:Cytochrome bc1 complex Rieske iron-sulfur subunit n=1 Tax=Catenulispora acidiphila (strain DSM 44928 / JCM 14897 / NBRC 102108 / NRRL B-24433 / ID139908) TaxID=479433 RepID=C7PVL7_CATAD|nr:Rieske (2Fe-2S) protein [Catenulispora acidiphila]ACU69373.1 Rieske (2Fe-2S) domain protein [Catenulispora acidiphila DSM 44928]